MINETELSRQYCDHHPAEAAAVLMRIAPQAAADFLTTLPPLRAAALLQYMLPGRAADILLCLDADPLGNLLATPPLTLLHDWTVKYSLREFRSIPPTTVAELPVVDQHHVLLGTVSLHRLLTQREDLHVGYLVDTSLPPLPAEAPLASVAQHPLWGRTTAATVVEHDNKLLGVLHHARLLEYLSSHTTYLGLI